MNDFIHNYVLIVGLAAWFLAQLIKMVLVLIETKQLKWERMVGSGGMPSAHSASICAVVVAIAKSMGVSSPLFALAFLVAAIVMHDAMGVRLEAGKHAKIINVLRRQIDIQEISDDGHLKELLGHTTRQVFAGALLGIVIAVLIPVF